ncbi:hypothetical protein EIP91_000332 [Steccherinum ochraceum]|uniref:D-lactate dehydratase n=1 Tax=Steccherinum ochraceum TaxID=92696 RepID=A0A4R0RMK9_9APHY|nr:hypothetical protein EIP91_000332 [Steccherinum ochraceum]
MSSAGKVLFVFTSADTNKIGGPTGWYLPEAAHPYYTLAPHFDIDFAAPKGPNPPLDQNSVASFAKDPQSVQFLADETVKSKLATAKTLTEVNADDYLAVFYPGGHGPVIDLAFDENNTKLLNAFYRSDKIVSAVCHGTAALVQGTGADGKPLVAGKEVSGFTNDEEETAGLVNTVPFLLETKVKELGAIFVKAENFQPKIAVSGKLITGQNPASAAPLGEALLKALKA